MGTAEVLGWLYVTEGSTLGGAIIARRLPPLVAPLGVPAFLRPYPEGPGPMWQSYLAHLDEWVGADASRAERVVAAAVSTFDALEAWVRPLRIEDAA